eukprot:XP_011602604.1 PREDICTED: synaptotagmin-3 [Takifugu rubripes]
MSGDWDEDVCKKAMELVEELCFNSPRGYSQSERCQEFSYLLRGRNRQLDTEISVSLLSVIVTFCGIVLLSVSLFVSWKLCWLPWRDKEGGGLSLTSGLLPGSAGVGGLGGGSLLPPLMQRKEGHSSSSLYPSLGQHHPHFSDMVGLERGEGGGVVGGPHETQEPSYLDMDTYPNNAAAGHRQAKPMTHQLSSPDFHEEKEQVTCIGQIKPELYRPKGDQGEGKQGDNCGKISFLLRYAFNTEQLVVKILKALDLPAKDANGFSDPYVKIYLLPDRKKKFQTKVHRKTLNPVFNETFQFGVPLNELHSRKLHFSVYDFDRFSRHDLIGQVVVDNLLDFSEGSGDKPIWRDIVEGTAEKADLGELNFSLCYLPTAGRLTVTIGHNEVIGMCRVGSDAEGPGREHWTAMLGNPRKPIEHWHQLVEEKAIGTFVSKSETASSPKPHIVVDSPHSD